MFLLFLEILLSVLMVLDCVVLVFLVLMQLPKKEAGAGGLAFGGAATDALFGAGSGNFLTKATKYTAGIFFVLAIVLSLIQSYRVHHGGSNFLQQMKEQSRPTITAPPPPPAQSAPAAQPGTTANTNLLLAPIESATNAAPTTTAPANTGSTNQSPQK